MNILKKALSLLLAGVMVFSFAACHEKGEIAVTVKDGEVKEEFTSALYLFTLMTADSEASEKASAQLEEAGADTSSITLEQVYAEKLDNKSYTTWVRDRAKEILTEYAAYKIKCDQNGITLDEDTLAEIESNAQIYWSYYGYQSIYEVNGISYDTFKAAMTYPYYSNAYFESVYGEGGEKAVAQEEVLKAMEENFVIANVLEIDLSDMKDDEVAETKKTVNSYVSRLKKGTPFSEIYNEHYEIEEEEETTSSDATSSEAEEEEDILEPKDAYASLLGSADTDYASDHFGTVKEMKTGEVKLVESAENKTITILVRGDMMSDEYWTTNLNTVVLSLLKGEEFETAMDEYMATLTVKVNSSATKRFDVKDLYKYSK